MSKCVRIEYEYEDGRVYRATGDDAEAICKHYRSCEVMDAIHGGHYSGPQLQLVTSQPIAAHEKAPGEV